MLLTVCVGSNDLEAAGEFYDAVLGVIGMTRNAANDCEIGYGAAGSDDVTFWVLIPFDRRAATAGNGSQVTFSADGAAQVDAFHAAVLARGGIDEGAPGPRDYSPGYYGAYCRDRDGNKLHVMCTVS